MRRRIPRGKGIANWVADKRQAAIVNDTVNDGRFYRGPDEERAFSTRSILAAPILADDEMLGVIKVLNKCSAVSFNERNRDDEQQQDVIGSRARSCWLYVLA